MEEKREIICDFLTDKMHKLYAKKALQGTNFVLMAFLLLVVIVIFLLSPIFMGLNLEEYVAHIEDKKAALYIYLVFGVISLAFFIGGLYNLIRYQNKINKIKKMVESKQCVIVGKKDRKEEIIEKLLEDKIINDNEYTKLKNKF